MPNGARNYGACAEKLIDGKLSLNQFVSNNAYRAKRNLPIIKVPQGEKNE